MCLSDCLYVRLSLLIVERLCFVVLHELHEANLRPKIFADISLRPKILGVLGRNGINDFCMLIFDLQRLCGSMLLVLALRSVIVLVSFGHLFFRFLL